MDELRSVNRSRVPNASSTPIQPLVTKIQKLNTNNLDSLTNWCTIIWFQLPFYPFEVVMSLKIIQNIDHYVNYYFEISRYHLKLPSEGFCVHMSLVLIVCHKMVIFLPNIETGLISSGWVSQKNHSLVKALHFSSSHTNSTVHWTWENESH